MEWGKERCGVRRGEERGGVRGVEMWSEVREVRGGEGRGGERWSEVGKGEVRD